MIARSGCWRRQGSSGKGLSRDANPRPPIGLMRSIRPPSFARAASLHPQAVSGWDIAMNRPRPTRFAVPAGSVYHVEGDFRPPGGSLCASQELAAEGWGFAL